MSKCIVHIGMPKTGTTSIQLSLLYSLRKDRYCFVTLDSFFGNQMMLAAFSESEFQRSSVFLRGMNQSKLDSLRASARSHLDRCLLAARKSGRIPVISSEKIWSFSEPELRSFSSFLGTRGFQPTLYGYLRAPLDEIESLYQQLVRVGYADSWERLKRLAGHFAYEQKAAIFDEIFGRESVHLTYYDPETFNEKCVVMDFCNRAGIEMRKDKVIRINQSLNANAVKYLYATTKYREQRNTPTPSWRYVPDRIKWATLLRLLQGAPGPPFRFHRSMVSEFIDGFKSQWPAIEKRIGRSLPMSLFPRSHNEGIRTESDLNSFDDTALEWLVELCGGPPITNQSGPSTSLAVAKQIDHLSLIGYPKTTTNLLLKELRLRCKRSFMKLTGP